MAWNSSFLVPMASLYLMNLAIAKNPCKTKVSVPGMALKGFVFKKVPVSAPHVCDITCERETICQSYNYVIGEKSCELNSRTKEARPENFQPDDFRFYMGRISGRTPLGSIPELTALSCQEIKLSEGKDSISKKYWLDPANVGSSELVYCDMILEDIDECKGSNNVNCDENANCSNTVGSYNCTCKDGFTGDGHSCSDIDECKGNHSCHVNATCTNTNGSYLCECQPGFNGNGQSCTAPLGSIPKLSAISCQEIKLSEGKDSISKNYWLDPTNVGSSNLIYCDMILEEIDECKSSNSVCDENANCSNTVGFYNCTCKEEFTGDRHSCSADPCFHYKNLSDANRKITYVTPDGSELCDSQLLEEWYRFVGAAGTKMPTTRVPAFRCGTHRSGWLDDAHPTVKDGEVFKKVCFSDHSTGCRYTKIIFVKNCGSYFIYRLTKPPRCDLRYCSAD